MVNETQTVPCMTFSIPSDFPSLEDSVFGSLKKGFKDYCFNHKQLKKIIEKCHETSVSMVYREQMNEDYELEYIELIPCSFYFAKTTEENKVENIQVNIKELPVALIFCPRNNKSDNTIGLEERKTNKKRVKNNKKLAYFDDEGYPVYIEDLKKIREEKEEKENGV